MATKTKTTVKTCLLPNCKKPAKSRGLCANHYHTATKAVARGKHTWDELVKVGAAKASAAPQSNGFLEFVAKKKGAAKAQKAKPKARPKAPTKAEAKPVEPAAA